MVPGFLLLKTVHSVDLRTLSFVKNKHFKVNTKINKTTEQVDMCPEIGHDMSKKTCTVLANFNLQLYSTVL